MPVESTKAMPSSTSRSETRGRPVRPCTAGGCGGVNGSKRGPRFSLVKPGGGETRRGKARKQRPNPRGGTEAPHSLLQGFFQTFALVCGGGRGVQGSGWG